MAEPGMIAGDVIFKSKHDGRQWSVTTTTDEAGLTGIFKIPVKGIMAQQAAYAIHAFRRIHIVVDDNGIILCIIKAYSLQVEYGPQYRQ